MRLLLVLAFVASNAQAKNLDSDTRSATVVMVCNNTRSNKEVAIGTKCRIAKETDKTVGDSTRKSRE